MSRRPPRSTRTDTLFPYTTLFRSVGDYRGRFRGASCGAIPTDLDAKDESIPENDVLLICVAARHVRAQFCRPPMLIDENRPAADAERQPRRIFADHAGSNSFGESGVGSSSTSRSSFGGQ